ncbi:HTH domain-containing protein [Enterococcus casseliflavus]|nr:HTH domain-containing protein [Enterococcus casseliflavus]MBO1142568.1 HTH domain-containing protein [Enterococcus casseliflavus]
MRELQLGFISNKTTVRLLKILNYIEHKNRFTIGELAENVVVSERTIASDIKYLKDHFEDSAEFVSGSKGVIFREIHLSEYKERKKQLFSNECLFEIIQQIFYGKLDRIEELAHRYNYSETSFRRLLVQSTPVLKSYGLLWQTNPLTIGGREGNLRKFFKDFFYEGVETPFTIIPDNKLHDFFIQKFMNEMGRYSVGSGTTPEAFYYTLYIAINRVSLDKTVSIPKELQKKVFNEHDFLVFSSITEVVEELYKVKLPKEELAWIYLVTICKRTIDREDLEKTFFDHFNLWPEIPGITKRFLQKRGIPSAAHQKLAIYLNAFFLSRKINDTIAPALNKELLDNIDKVVDDKQYTFEKNEAFFQEYKVNVLLSPKYIKEICMSFTLYSEMVIELHSPSKRIYFLLEGNHFICQMIRTKAIKLFGERHQLVFVPLQLLTKETLNTTKIDLVVTNYDRYITDFIENKDYLLIKEIPDKQDWRVLTYKIDA